MARAKTTFADCLVIINPVSTRSEQAVDSLDVLNDFFAKDAIERITLKEHDFDDDSRVVQRINQLRADSLIIIIGGDGTVSQVGNAILRAKSIDTQQCTLLPLVGGNASDVAYMINGDDTTNLGKILEQGVQKQAFALDVTLANSDMNGRQFAFAYVSFGASAATMTDLDGIGRRYPLLKKSRVLMITTEAIIGLVALFKARRIEVSVNGEPAQKFYDLMYINGPRVAKLYRTHVQLTEPRFMQLALRSKHPVLLGHLSSWLMTVFAKKTIGSTQELTFTEAVWMQRDGEIHQLPAGTSATIAKEMQPYNVLSCIPSDV